MPEDLPKKRDLSPEALTVIKKREDELKKQIEEIEAEAKKKRDPLIEENRNIVRETTLAYVDRLIREEDEKKGKK